MKSATEKSRRIRIKRGLWVLQSTDDEYPLGFSLANDSSIFIKQKMAYSVYDFMAASLDSYEKRKAIWPFKGFRDSPMLEYSPGENIVNYFGNLCFSGYPFWSSRIWIDDDQAKAVLNAFKGRLTQSDKRTNGGV